MNNMCEHCINSVLKDDKLPPLVQKAVGTPDNLKELAQMDSQLVHSGGQTRFVNAYKTVVMRNCKSNHRWEIIL